MREDIEECIVKDSSHIFKSQTQTLILKYNKVKNDLKNDTKNLVFFILNSKSFK